MEFHMTMSAADARAPGVAADEGVLEDLEPETTLAWDIVDEWGVQSFPASDPPTNW